MKSELCEKLYRAYYMQVYSFLVSLTRDGDLAEELTQETFYKALVSRSSFRSESKEITWLCSIAKNLFTDEMRRRGKYADADDNIDSGISIEDDAADKDYSIRIHKILHTLNNPYKEVFELRVFGELSFSEIGTIFGKTESWARVTYHRARLQIRERMVK